MIKLFTVAVLALLTSQAMYLPSANASDVELRFATLTSISKAPPGVVAETHNLFEKEGVHVKMKLFTSGKAAVESLASGQFDIAMIGDIPALALLGQGYPGKIIAAGLGGPKRQSVLVKRDSPYKTVEDLKGKRIGLTKGSTDDIALGATFKKHNIKWSDVTVVNLRPPAKAAALETGAVDAVEGWEPVPAIIVTKGIGRRLFSADGDIPDIVGVIVASDKILREHPDAVVRFLRAIHGGASYARAHPDEMVDLLSKRLGLDRKILIDAIPTQWWYVEVFSDTISDWQRSADLLFGLKRLASRPDVAGLVDLSYLSKALGKKYPRGESAADVMKYPTVSITQ